MPDLNVARVPLLAVAEGTALDTAGGWAAFKDLVVAEARPVLDRWVAGRCQLLTAEFAAGDLPEVWSNGAVEQALQRIEEIVGRRAFCFRNAERTNRLLELVRLHLNRADDTGRYATAIRRHLATAGSTTPQLSIRDRGVPSLR